MSLRLVPPVRDRLPKAPVTWRVLRRRVPSADSDAALRVATKLGGSEGAQIAEQAFLSFCRATGHPYQSRDSRPSPLGIQLTPNQVLEVRGTRSSFGRGKLVVHAWDAERFRRKVPSVLVLSQVHQPWVVDHVGWIKGTEFIERASQVEGRLSMTPDELEPIGELLLKLRGELPKGADGRVRCRWCARLFERPSDLALHLPAICCGSKPCLNDQRAEPGGSARYWKAVEERFPEVQDA